MTAVIPFPQHRRVGKARHVAAIINRRRTAHERAAYFQRVCRQLATSLRQIGLTDEQVSYEVQGFVHAVNLAIGEGWHFPGDHVTGEQLNLFRDEPPGAA